MIIFWPLHGVSKWQKKSHSTASYVFTFWVDKCQLKMPKMVHFGKFLKTWSLRSNSFTRQVSFNMTKIGGKCQNSNVTLWVIFKCKNLVYLPHQKVINECLVLQPEIFHFFFSFHNCRNSQAKQQQQKSYLSTFGLWRRKWEDICKIIFSRLWA